MAARKTAAEISPRKIGRKKKRRTENTPQRKLVARN